jgi:hypothetical protein
MHDLFIQTLQPELAVGIAAGCMRVAAGKMFVVNRAIGLCCLGIHRASLQQFCEGMFKNSVYVSTTRGLSHTSIFSGGTDPSIAHDCYTCEGAWLWQRFGCFVDNLTMHVRCVRPLLLPGLPLTSRREIQALLLPAAVPSMLPGNMGWMCGTALPICAGVTWMEQELAVTVDSVIASQHDGVPRDFLQRIMPALLLKTDCIFSATSYDRMQTVAAIKASSHSAALACAMRLSDLVYDVASSSIELPRASKPQISDTCQLLCSLLHRCCQRSRPQLWDTPDFATLNSNSHADIINASVLWPVGCRAVAGAIVSILVKERSSSNGKYPQVQQIDLCSWSPADLCVISSYEASNFAPISLGSADISSVISDLLQFCGHCISKWQPQPIVDFNEGLLLLQVVCGGCQPDFVMSAATLQRLLEFTIALLGSHKDEVALGGVRHPRQLKQQAANNDEFQVKFKQTASALECAIGICCNAIEVLHVRFSALACRISASQEFQLLNLAHASLLLDEIMSSPIKANAPLVSFAQELHLILDNVSHKHILFPFFRSCSHAFTLIAACANASRGNFVRSCLATCFFRLFENAVDEAAPAMQGDVRAWCVCIIVCILQALFLQFQKKFLYRGNITSHHQSIVIGPCKWLGQYYQQLSYSSAAMQAGGRCRYEKLPSQVSEMIWRFIYELYLFPGPAVHSTRLPLMLALADAYISFDLFAKSVISLIHNFFSMQNTSHFALLRAVWFSACSRSCLLTLAAVSVQRLPLGAQSVYQTWCF